jgi:hypothetical protein
MKLLKLGIIAGVVMLGGVVFAQESEFQGKMQEDMDGYKAQLVEACGITDKVVVRYDGKLGSNPREIKEGDYTGISTLCTSGLDAIHDGARRSISVGSRDQLPANAVENRSPEHGGDATRPERRRRPPHQRSTDLF